MNKKNIFFLLLAGFIVSLSCSCKKKKKPETITFDYTYPDITYSVKDSASFGSTSAGWTYIFVEKVSNADFLKVLSDKNISSKDVSAVKMTSCTLTMTSTPDSSFNMFDSIFVKVGGTFVIGSDIYVSAAGDELVGQFYPVPKTGLKSITMQLTDVNLTGQIAVDQQFAFRSKYYSFDHILLPPISMKAVCSFSITGTTH